MITVAHADAIAVRRYTGMNDCNGKPIYEGDIVLKNWGFRPGADGKMLAIFHAHRIEFWQEGSEMRWLLGTSHNLWAGKEVEVVDPLLVPTQAICSKDNPSGVVHHREFELTSTGAFVTDDMYDPVFLAAMRKNQTDAERRILFG